MHKHIWILAILLLGLYSGAAHAKQAHSRYVPYSSIRAPMYSIRQGKWYGYTAMDNFVFWYRYLGHRRGEYRVLSSRTPGGPSHTVECSSDCRAVYGPETEQWATTDGTIAGAVMHDAMLGYLKP